MKIARGDLSAICRAINVMQPKDSVDLHNLPLVINVKLKKRTDNDELTNEIKGYESRKTGNASAQASSQSEQTAASDQSAPWLR